MKIILGLLILCLIVIMHEIGHMVVAKINHVEVKEFWVGFGPELLSFEKGGTRYVLRLIPLGGACVFDEDLEEKEDKIESDGISAKANALSEDDLYVISEDDSEAKTESVCENVKYDRKGRRLLKLREASVTARIEILFAGAFFNFLLAFIMGIVVVYFSYIPGTTVTDVTVNSPAEEAGIVSGDKIIKVNGSRVYLYPEVSLAIQTGIGSPLSLVYEHDGQKIKTELIPELNEEYGYYMIGVSFGSREEFQRSLGKSLKDSFLYVRYMIKMTFSSIRMMFSGQAGVKDLSGPVGVASVVSDEYDAAAAISPLAVVVSMMNIAVLISANLGVMNLLPFPALDGGRLVFAFYELITRKKPDAKIEGVVHLIGAALLVVLMIVVFFNDILRLFGM